MTHSASLPKRSSQLDLLRTIAILLVFLTHFNNFGGGEWFKAVGQFGWVGVDLFFVLSGFLISSQLMKEMNSDGRVSLKKFYIKRGFRIWPNYFFVLILYWTVPAFIERSTLPPLWKFLSFTQNFGLDLKTRGAFSHAWSLCVEEQFYIVLPFVLIALSHFGNFKRSLLIVISSIGGGILLRFWLWQRFVGPFYNTPSIEGIKVPFFREIYYPTYCRMDGLVIGVAIAALYRFRPGLWDKLSAYSNRVFAFSLFLLGGALYFVRDEVSLVSATLGFSLIALGFGCLTIAALSPSGLLAKVRIPGIQSGATLAFSFYLTHKQIIHLARRWLIQAGVPTESPLYPIGIFVACLVASILLYLAIERPFMQLRDRILNP